MPELIPVQFHAQEITTTVIDGVPHVALKPICENIGLQWHGQRERVKRHHVLNSVARMTRATGPDGKQYEMLMLPIAYLNGWLFGVDSKRVKPEIKDRLIQYQQECYMVLANHFLPPAEPKAFAKPEITSVYQLAYVQDTRKIPGIYENIRWWFFNREDLAPDGSSEQGRRFIQQTIELAKHNPDDAEQAITWSLMHIMQTNNRHTFFMTEYEYCKAIAKAAVAQFRRENRVHEMHQNKG